MDRVLPLQLPEGDRAGEQARSPARLTLLDAALAAAFAAALLLWRRTLDVTFFALSADDFHRTLYAWQVTQGQLVPSPLWPPLQFWVEALALRVYPHILSVPYLVNLAASALTLGALALLGLRLGLGAGERASALLLAGTLPWFIWLSLSGLGEPLYLLGVVAGYAGVAWWAAEDDDRGLWLAAAGFAAAGMVRFDTWGHAAPFSAIVALRWLRASPRRGAWLLAAAALWVFPLCWLGWQWQAFGHPLHFAGVVRWGWLSGGGPLSPEARLLWQPRDLWALAGVTLPLGLAGAWLLRRRPGVPWLACMWGASFAAQIASTYSYAIPMHNQERAVVAHALLLTPGAAYAISSAAGVITHRAAARLVFATLLLAAVVAPRIPLVPSYPNALARDIQLTASHVGALRTMGVLRPGERILIEVMFWDYIIQHVMMNDPGAVLYDREPKAVVRDGQYLLDDDANPSLLALPPDALRAALRERDVRVVISFSDRAAERLRQIARQSEQAGRFTVFVLEGH